MKGKHIVLGITGGIAAYKSASLLRLFVKAGAEVQVVATPAALEFITPVTLSALSGKPVVSQFFTANTGEWHSHVDLGLWADAMVIAPATACTLGKMANGIADNMLATTYFSMRAPIFAAPAMDLDMWAHPATQRNVSRVKQDGVKIIEPGSGELASHLVGKGRMAEPEEIFEYVKNALTEDKPLEGKKILITAGPTVENIDPVRFISNYSSGKMGYALAEACAEKGAEVVLVSGPVNITTNNPAIRKVSVTSAEQMLKACLDDFSGCDAAILCAAVADYAPKVCADKKIKRSGNEEMVIELRRNPDIAAALGKLKTDNQLLCGFALETDNEMQNAEKKLESKNLDWIALNSLRDADAGFGKDTNRVTMISRQGEKIPLAPGLKTEVARSMVDLIFNQPKG